MSTEVSILLLSCNRPAWLEVSLRSVLAQTFGDFEVLVRDDSSGDDVENFVASLGDRRVRYTRGKRAGQLANFLGALSETDGAIVLVLHDDDWWEPTMLERLVVPMLKDPLIDIATSPFFFVDADGSPLMKSTTRRERLRPEVAPPGVQHVDELAIRAREMLIARRISPFIGSAIRRRCYDGLHIPEEAGSVLDLWLCAHLAKTTSTWFFEPTRLSAYRVHDSSIASAMSDLDPQRWCVNEFLKDPDFAPIHRELRESFRDFSRQQALGRIVLGDRRRARAELHYLRLQFGWRTRVVNLIVTRQPVAFILTRWLAYRNPRLSAMLESR